MKTAEWKTYRTRFLVNAKQLTCSLSFTDELGRQHAGRKGDYLVESDDGLLRIAPRQIFEDIYVGISLDELQKTSAAESRPERRKTLRSCQSITQFDYKEEQSRYAVPNGGYRTKAILARRSGNQAIQKEH
ncbi:MAG TPA: hypothetical protein VI386_02750 [Candidatus Sulfotelmatobacter sp.]